jgi:hypothetical protein
MKIVKIIGMVLSVSLLGIIAGLVTAGLLIRHEDTSSTAPGGGFLIFLCAMDGLLFSIPLSVLLAIWSWRRASKPKAAN